MTASRILVCTVGGSHGPVVTAVGAVVWRHVIFICTEGSEGMITKHVTVPGRNGAAAAELPPIPSLARLDPAVWSTLIVPADDPDRIFASLIERLDALHREQPDAEVTIDFTGGTKSMSAGAVLAAASRPGTRLQVTSGQRSDLVRVVDGTQQAIGLGTHRIVLDRQIALLRETWSRYGYQEAAEGFDKLVQYMKTHQPASGDLRRRLKFWAALGRAFAAWDRFDRRQARQNMKDPRRIADPALLTLAEFGDRLANDSSNPSSLVLFDLLRNAERCVARGRYDDAAARCYRLWEWTAQWLLQAEDGISTANVDPARLPEGFTAGLAPKPNGMFEIGSARAWKLHRLLHPAGNTTCFWNTLCDGTKTNEEQLRNLSQIRNNSILAHGNRPIDKNDAVRIMAWTQGPFVDLLRQEARRLGQSDDMPQLPTDLPEPVTESGQP